MTLDIQINLTGQSDINEGKVSHLGFQKCEECVANSVRVKWL